MSVAVINAPLLGGVRHGFLGRQGGVSQGMVAGLNVGLGSFDDSQAVAENRRRACDAVAPGAALVTVFQVHGIEVAIPESAWPDDARPHADALVTDRPGLALGILTADCAPVLFADVEAGVIGAAHAGWKGAIGGVTDATVEAMERRGARRKRIVAVVGPCIAQPSYEVDTGFRDRFFAMDPANHRFFAAGRPDRFQFDLPGYVVARLEAAGLGAVASVGLDTLELSGRFYSYRRATLAHEADYGRQISLIALP
jgi:polyphenol oxidase